MQHPKRRIPEVVQTSAMDCGPATLKALLSGFHIEVNYGRLREACQTDLDGTSIDTIEELAVQLGLNAEQIIIPIDHLLLPESHALPAIVVTRQPNGLTHFVVVWRMILGRWLEVMDPATGRKWLPISQFLESVYLHTMSVSIDAWFSWAKTADFVNPLQARMRSLSLPSRQIEPLITKAVNASSWHHLAALDAAVRFVENLTFSRFTPEKTARLIEYMASKAFDPSGKVGSLIPSDFWSVEPLSAPPKESPSLKIKGTVLVRVSEKILSDSDLNSAESLPPDLAAVLHAPAPDPEREFWRLLTGEGLSQPWTIALLAIISGGLATLEALFWRHLLDLGYWLTAIPARLSFVVGFLGLLVLNLIFGWIIYTVAFTAGRGLEINLRLAYLRKIPRLKDRFLASRPISDMAERSHHIHRLRQIPLLASLFLRAVFQLTFIVVGLFLLLPPPLRILGGMNAFLAVSLPLFFQPALIEKEGRVRTHIGALSYFYLDALRGLVPIRTHGAERNLLREHENLLVEWGRASATLLRIFLSVETLVHLLGVGLAAALVYFSRQVISSPAALLLTAYWAFLIPILGQELAGLARIYPIFRNHALRVLEPLGATEDPDISPKSRSIHSEIRLPIGDISLENVTVRAGGHTILKAITCRISQGEHIAIIGPSGAGKSSLIGLLLGWHRPAEGRIKIGDQALDGPALAAVRSHTAWVEPGIHLWNRTLVDNVRYGRPNEDWTALGQIVEQAELVALLERLPDGWQTPLGENGGLVSGGEGQRVRLSRGMVRKDVSLVILDEPFRGLDRGQRHRLLENARRYWPRATILCVTHDIEETGRFDRVLVMEQGQIVEDIRPILETAPPGSRYRDYCLAEDRVRSNLWSADFWRRWQINQHQVIGQERGPDPH